MDDGGQMPQLKRVHAIVVAALLIGIGGLVAFQLDWHAPKATLATVRVGWLTGDLHHLPYFVARDRDIGHGRSFFEEYGLNVTDSSPVGYPNGPAEMDAIAAGDVDVGFVGLSPAITKHLNAEVNTIVVAQVNSIGSALVVRYPVTSLHDLRTKTIATPGPGTVQYFLLLKLIEEEGENVADYVLIKLAPKDMRASMEANTIDAFVAWEPYCSDSVVDNIGVIYKNSSDIWPNHICCVIVVHKTFAMDHPDVVINFLKAHVKATNWINRAKDSGSSSEDYASMIDIAVNFTGRSVAVIEQALKNIEYGYEIDDGFMQCFTDFTYKLIQYEIVAYDRIEASGYANIYDFASKYIDTSYLKKAK